ncbi:MAG: prolyl oligopeptidase family serine peptidase [Planctomycetaceae bacterium]|jgi:poly(3-hydroxybutyrate) depolymerase|nr:prolyl oligopeptidase family serine peptidase [Planctomycetaceae bacterium]
MIVVMAVTATWLSVVSAQEKVSQGQEREERPAGRFVAKVYKDGDGTHKYQVFLPAGYDANRRYPVIMYLHGADECGRDGIKPTQIGLGPYVRARAAEFPFLVVFPQCETTRGRRFLERWQAGSPDGQRALKILDEVEKDYSVDRSREILTGWSMGGYGTWSLAIAHPKRWAAVVPVAGGGDVTKVAAVRETPVWVIHGPGDRTVYPEQSRRMVDALKRAGGLVRYDEPRDETHSVWQRAYDSAVLEKWLLDPRQPLPEKSVALVARGTRLPVDLSPFVPVAHIGGAAYLRIGTEVLDAIAGAIPSAIPKDIISGTLEPLVFKDVEGKKKYYEATLDNISYTGEIQEVSLETQADASLRARLALRNLTVKFGRTVIDRVKLDDRKVNGRREYFEKDRDRKFSTGLTEIRVAHERPVMLEIVVRPTIKDRRARLSLVKSSFSIDEDQFVVVGPNKSAIEASGLFKGLKQNRVYDEIVNGLSAQRGLFEEKVRDVVPMLLEEMEAKLDFADSSDLFRSLWPLPVFQPRVRIWPEALTVEKSGISVAIGMTVAAADPEKAPRKPRELTLVKDLINQIPRTGNMRIGFAPALLQPLTSLLIESGVARVDVRDTPEELVRELGSRSRLVKVIPALAALPATTDVRTELVLTRSIAVIPSDDSPLASRAPMKFRFSVPGLELAVSTRESREGPNWQPLASFAVTLEHMATMQLLPPEKGERRLKVGFAAPPKITVVGRWAKGVSVADRSLHDDVFHRQFDRAWRAFAGKALEATVAVSDFQFGDVSLPLFDIGWASPMMYVEFGLASRTKAASRKVGQAGFERPVPKASDSGRSRPAGSVAPAEFSRRRGLPGTRSRKTRRSREERRP